MFIIENIYKDFFLHGDYLVAHKPGQLDCFNLATRELTLGDDLIVHRPIAEGDFVYYTVDAGKSDMRDMIKVKCANISTGEVVWESEEYVFVWERYDCLKIFEGKLYLPDRPDRWTNFLWAVTLDLTTGIELNRVKLVNDFDRGMYLSPFYICDEYELWAYGSVAGGAVSFCRMSTQSGKIEHLRKKGAKGNEIAKFLLLDIFLGSNSFWGGNIYSICMVEPNDENCISWLLESFNVETSETKIVDELKLDYSHFIFFADIIGDELVWAHESLGQNDCVGRDCHMVEIITYDLATNTKTNNFSTNRLLPYMDIKFFDNTLYTYGFVDDTLTEKGIISIDLETHKVTSHVQLSSQFDKIDVSSQYIAYSTTENLYCQSR